MIANNTVCSSDECFRVWDDEPYEEYHPEQVAVLQNLFWDAGRADLALVHRAKAAQQSHAGDPTKLCKAWVFGDNWRALSGSLADRAIPKAREDKIIPSGFSLSRDTKAADFLRPAADSPLATGRAGRDDPSLPIYVGAVPPKGTPVWDWDKTWRWRVKRAAIPKVETDSAKK